MRFSISKNFQFVLLLELVFPVVLLSLGLFQGFLQTLYRAGYIQGTSFLGIEYYQGLTLHGVVNAIVLTTFFAVAFGSALVAYALKREPNRLWNALAALLMILGTSLAAWTILSGKASVLYTFYPPLKGHPLFYIGTTLLVIGSWIAFFTWIPLYLSWKKENPGQKTPLAVYGIFTTFIVWFLATSPVAIEILVFLLPWSLGWTAGVNVMLTRTLFWFFGHPLVYFWLLPTYVMYYVMLPKLAGGKLFSDKAGRWAFALFIILSIPVGVHHQFTEPAFREGTRLLHAILTFGVALPSFITAVTMAASLEHAGNQNGGRGYFGWWFKLPYFSRDKYLFPYFFTGLVIFFFGGITGIMNASYSMNTLLHNTAWMPGHFHLTVAGPVFLGILGMSLHLTAELTGKEVKWKSLNVLVPWLWMVGLFFFSSGMMFGGLHGEPRRTNMGMSYLSQGNPLFKSEWVTSTRVTVVGGAVMSLSALFYFLVFIRTLFSKKVRTDVGVEFPISEAYHDEKRSPILDSFTPWIVFALILIAVAYVPAIMDAVNNTTELAPPFSPQSPLPLK
ncbi:MAG: cbb3-type cytochrome c oxidase subunit I [Spirochaetia bacterium]|nr:cbb3-type cytochrome c oxidase subunit I [Spirochaetia bacterium]